MYAIREDASSDARWLKEFSVGLLQLLQFDCLDPTDPVGLVLCTTRTEALNLIAANQFMSGAVTVECYLVDEVLVFHP